MEVICYLTHKQTKLSKTVFQYSFLTIHWQNSSKSVIMKVEMHGQVLTLFSNDTNGDLWQYKHRVYGH